jgi:2-octaprenylphenol hydroxylase
MNTAYDLMITGGGIIGLAFALAVADTDLKIAIIESQPFPEPQVFKGYDVRVSAITRASEKFLTQIGAWQYLPAEKITAYQGMQVWDAGSSGHIEFDSSEVAQAELGFIIENRLLRQALLQALKMKTNIMVLAPLRLVSLQQQAQGVNVQTEAGDFISARLIVGADGANSWLRQQLNIQERAWEYNQQAIVATVRCEKNHEHIARQRFLTTGPLAFLPLSEPDLCSIVWSSREATRLMQLSEAEFAAELTEQFENKLGAVTLLDQRLSFPLKMRHAKQYVQEHCALIGDAIHTIHPLAGQGLNLGLADAACLAEVIKKAHSKQRDFSSLSTLRRYERSRKGSNWAMIASMEGFKRLFSNEQKPLIQIRSMGLNLVNSCNPLKNYFITQAMGL